MEGIDHRIETELPPPASEFLGQFQCTISLFSTQIEFDTMKEEILLHALMQTMKQSQ